MPTPRRLPLPAVSAALALALVAVGCSPGAASPSPASDAPSPAASPSDTAGSVDHPTGATDVILRFEEGGGMLMVDFAVTQAPIFTLYGDGTVVVRDPAAQPPPAANGLMVNAPFRTARLSEEQIQSLLSFAVAEGGLGAARERYEHPTVTDVGTAVFTINAGGRSKTVSVYALGFEDAPDQLARSQFERLADRLRTFEQAESFEMEDYEPHAWRAVMIESPGVAAKTFPWPWPEIEPADFETVLDDPTLPTLPFHTLTADDVAAMGLGELPGGVMGYYVNAPDGKTYSIPIRPLLPDEER
jgi:hypothetical protein